MSHIVEIQTQVRDAAAVRAGCDRLGLEAPQQGQFNLFRQQVTGLAVRLNQWRYPVVFNLETGLSQYDNFEGHWGPKARLDEFMQAYAIEKSKLEARRKGFLVHEQRLENGSVKLTVDVGGGA
ncbi:hypothetical protein NHH03_19200 [Stieleria sp. TO1_6]|uniref:hypothetical protein n=1 Tax=Stieleria tagensis TaxID=2956795 RepID=UPI00209B0DB2|nr:hypothetical protein [Stieleria tagensis]MCO8123881.1 hypothetical protein [Stieleria tagensis]